MNPALTSQPLLSAESDLPVGLAVSATPNPCDRYAIDSPIPPPHRYMWFYATTVRNITAQPLQVLAFAPWQRIDETWQPLTAVTQRPLCADDFRSWYRESDLDAEGWLPSDGSATDPQNWHGGDRRSHSLVRWTYLARDPQGRHYHGQVDIHSVPRRRHWLPKVRRCCGPDSCCD